MCDANVHVQCLYSRMEVKDRKCEVHHPAGPPSTMKQIQKSGTSPFLFCHPASSFEPSPPVDDAICERPLSESNIQNKEKFTTTDAPRPNDTRQMIGIAALPC